MLRQGCHVARGPFLEAHFLAWHAAALSQARHYDITMTSLAWHAAALSQARHYDVTMTSL
jgi:hypothetical protein